MTTAYLTLPTLLLATAAAAQTFNLAPQGTATQSSFANTGTPILASYGNDGNRDGNWPNYSVTATDNVPGGWWQVALPSAMAMDEIAVWNRADCCAARLSNFRVEALWGPFTSFRQDFFTTGGHVPSGGVLRIALGNGVIADTVKLTNLGLTADNSYHLQFAEVEVLQFGATRTTNVAPRGTATLSAADGSHAAGRAIDGNTDGYLPNQSVARSTNAPGSWLRVSVPRGAIHGVRLWPVTTGQLGTGNFRVAVYDGANEVVGVNLFAGTLMPTTAAANVALPSSPIGDAVRITTLGPVQGAERIELAEVEVLRGGHDIADVAVLGAGCLGSAGMPTLTGVGWPRPGQSFIASLRQVPAAPGLGLLLFGFSNAQWSGGSLPLHLQVFGANGCWALTSPDASVTGVPTGGTIAFPMALPNDPSFAGVRFYQQGVVLDAAVGNALGATVSNALRVHVGN